MGRVPGIQFEAQYTGLLMIDFIVRRQTGNVLYFTSSYPHVCNVYVPVN